MDNSEFVKELCANAITYIESIGSGYSFYVDKLEYTTEYAILKLKRDRSDYMMLKNLGYKTSTILELARSD